MREGASAALGEGDVVIDIEQLKALTRFLEGLTDLSLQTGIKLQHGGHYPTSLEVNGEYLDLVIGTDADGNTTYAVTRESDD